MEIGANRSVSNASAIMAGLIAGTAMALLILIASSLRFTSFNWLTFLGTWTGLEANSYGLIVGFLIHLGICALITLDYVWVFRRYDRSGFANGAMIGFGHWVVLGTLLGVLQRLHPYVPEISPGPGYFWTQFGFGTFSVYLLLTLLFGGMLGDIYHRYAVSADHVRGDQADGVVSVF